MPHLIEALLNTMRSMVDDEPKSPLHVGEVMSCWTYLTALEEAIVTIIELGLNTTTDDDLRHCLEESNKLCSGQSDKLRKFLINEGVPLPRISETKPKSDSYDIPLGVKLSDYEIANALSMKTAFSVITCASGAAESIRNDLGILFIRFQMEQMVFGASLKDIMRKHGWIKVPPYYHPPGLPHTRNSSM